MWKVLGSVFRLGGMSRSETSSRANSELLSGQQAQSVGVHGVALQAARDINVHGLSLADVQTACSNFFENNFPRLQQAAFQLAEANVRDFAQRMTLELERDAAKVLVEKFTDPDVQAAMNDAVKACARRGAAASPDVLAKLIVQRMAVASTPFIDVVLSEAVTVVPKLTPEQMAYLALVHTAKGVGLDVGHFVALQEMAELALPVIAPGVALSRAQREHLAYAGALSLSGLSIEQDMYVGTYKRYKDDHPTIEDVEAWKTGLSKHAPAFNQLIGYWDVSSIASANLTSVGQAIAITLLSPAYGGLNYGVWLK